MRPIPAPRIGDSHGILRAIEERGRLRTDELVTEFSLEQLFPPELENGVGRMRHFISYARSAGLVKEDRGVVELTDVGRRYVRAGDAAAPFDVSEQQAEWLRRQLREKHMTDSIFHGMAIGLSLLASAPPGARVSTLDFGRALAYLGRAGWDNENTFQIQGERYLTLLLDVELIDAEHRLTETGEQVRGELTLPVHMSLLDIAAQLNPGGADAVRAEAEAEWATAEPEKPSETGYHDVIPGSFAPSASNGEGALPAAAPSGGAEAESPRAAEAPGGAVEEALPQPAEAPGGGVEEALPQPAEAPPSAAGPPVPPADIWETSGPEDATRAIPAARAPVVPRMSDSETPTPPAPAGMTSGDPLAVDTPTVVTPPAGAAAGGGVAEAAGGAEAAAASSGPAEAGYAQAGGGAGAAAASSGPAGGAEGGVAGAGGVATGGVADAGGVAPGGGVADAGGAGSGAVADAGAAAAGGGVADAGGVRSGGVAGGSAAGGDVAAPAAGGVADAGGVATGGVADAGGAAAGGGVADAGAATGSGGGAEAAGAGAAVTGGDASASQGAAGGGLAGGVAGAAAGGGLAGAVPGGVAGAAAGGGLAGAVPGGVAGAAAGSGLAGAVPGGVAGAAAGSGLAGAVPGGLAGAAAAAGAGGAAMPGGDIAALGRAALAGAAGDLRSDAAAFVDPAGIRAAAEAAGLRFPDAVYANLAAALGSGKHVLLTGAPGAGKTSLALAVARAAAQSGRANGATLVTAHGEWADQAVVVESAKRGRWMIIDELDRADLDDALGALSSFLAGLPVLLGGGDEAAPDAGWRIVATASGAPDASAALLRRFAVVEVLAPAGQVLVAALNVAARGDATAAAAVARLVPLAEVAPLGAGVFIDAARHAAARNAAAPADEATLARDAYAAYIAPLLGDLDDLAARRVRDILGDA